ncbi:MAG: spoIIIJ-associated protein [Thermotogota bacterium]|nr:spoIIIJ-associated protein [Thermotogota bacterium]
MTSNNAFSNLEGSNLLKLYGTGETIEEAIEQAIKELRVKPEEDEYTVSILQKPRKGFLGMGKREAKVEVEINTSFIERVIREALKRLFEASGWQVESHVKANSRTARIELKNIDSTKRLDSSFFNDLEYILTIYANRFTSTRYSVKILQPKLDSDRERELQQLAAEVAREVLKTHRRYTFDPMPASERRIIHETIKKFEKLKSYSVGKEPDRKVVVELAKKTSKRRRKTSKGV